MSKFYKWFICLNFFRLLLKQTLRCMNYIMWRSYSLQQKAVHVLKVKKVGFVHCRFIDHLYGCKLLKKYPISIHACVILWKLNFGVSFILLFSHISVCSHISTKVSGNIVWELWEIYVWSSILSSNYKHLYIKMATLFRSSIWSKFSPKTRMYLIVHFVKSKCADHKIVIIWGC